MAYQTLLEKKIQNAGIRATQVRIAVMVYLMESGLHPSTEEIGVALSEKGLRIPVATLYQNLEKLTTAGLLVRFTSPDGQARYDANLAHHHHLFCNVCHRVADILIANPMSELAIFDARSGESVLDWTLENAKIELKGRCPGCSAVKQS